jgi:ParB family chromosome partitioning protein
MENLPEANNGTVRDIVAKESGFGSGKQYEKAKFILDNADDELIQSLDENKISIHGAYKRIINEKDELKKQNDQSKIKIKNLQNELNNKQKEVQKLTLLQTEINNNNIKIKRLEEDKLLLEKKVKLNEKEAEEYQQLKSNITNLQNEKSDLCRQIESITNISGFVVDIEHLLQNKLAPIKYSKAIAEQKSEPIIVNNLKEIVNRVRSWCDDMDNILLEKEYIDLEVI